jgi:hypothetical protein
MVHVLAYRVHVRAHALQFSSVCLDLVEGVHKRLRPSCSLLGQLLALLLVRLHTLYAEVSD